VNKEYKGLKARLEFLVLLEPQVLKVYREIPG
jgi:hypothetical protein